MLDYTKYISHFSISKFNSLPNISLSLLVVGEFFSKEDTTKIVDLGRPFSVRCPPHKSNYGATYNWENPTGIAFKQDSHRAILPDGELIIMYVTQFDVDEIVGLNGIGCTISGADNVYRSGFLTLMKRQPGKK